MTTQIRTVLSAFCRALPFGMLAVLFACCAFWIYIAATRSHETILLWASQARDTRGTLIFREGHAYLQYDQEAYAGDKLQHIQILRTRSVNCRVLGTLSYYAFVDLDGTRHDVLVSPT